MQFVIILLTLLSFLFSYRKERNIYNPLSLFSLYWLIVILLANLQLYGLYSASQKTYTFIAIGLFSFIIGYSVSLKKSNNIPIKRINNNYLVRYKLLIFLNILIIIFLFLRLINLINLLGAGYSWWEIRLMTTAVEKDLGLWGSKLNLFIYTYIVSPLVYFAVPTAILDYIVYKKSKLFVNSTIIVVVLFSIVTVSRNILVFSVIYLIASALIYRKKIQLSNRIRRVLKRIPLIVSIPIIGVITITLLRKAEANIFKEAYVYLAGAIPSFSIRLTEQVIDTHTYGMLTTRGFTRLFFIFLDNIGIHYPESYLNSQIVMENLERFITIGNDINMNAYATLFYQFYIDGGVLGIIFFSVVLGFICRKAYQGIKYNINIRNAVFYLLILQQLLFSVARIYTVYPTRALPFLLILFMFVKEKRKIH